ncbi:MAG: hypothetical protein ACT4PT_00740 [Methanobacteriota archaeon]
MLPAWVRFATVLSLVLLVAAVFPPVEAMHEPRTASCTRSTGPSPFFYIRFVCSGSTLRTEQTPAVGTVVWSSSGNPANATAWPVVNANANVTAWKILLDFGGYTGGLSGTLTRYANSTQATAGTSSFICETVVGSNPGGPIEQNGLSKTCANSAATFPSCPAITICGVTFRASATAGGGVGIAGPIGDWRVTACLAADGGC